MTGRAIAGTGPTGAVTMAGAGGNTIGGCASGGAGQASVPTLSGWGMIALLTLLALAGVVAMRRL